MSHIFINKSSIKTLNLRQLDKPIYNHLMSYALYMNRSLGITAIELAEGRPPYAHLRPAKAMYEVVEKPPPKLRDRVRWSVEFDDFIYHCLRKDPSERQTASQLLQHPFVQRTMLNNKESQRSTILSRLVEEYMHKPRRQTPTGTIVDVEEN